MTGVLNNEQKLENQRDPEFEDSGTELVLIYQRDRNLGKLVVKAEQRTQSQSVKEEPSAQRPARCDQVLSPFCLPWKPLDGFK